MCDCVRHKTACHCLCHENMLELFVKDTKDLGVHFYFTLDKEKKTKRKIDALTWNQVTGSQKKKLTASLDVSKYYLDKKAGQKVFLFVLFSPPPSALTLPFFL